MAQIAIFHAAFAGSEEVETRVSSRLGLTDLTPLLLKETADRFGMSEDKLVRAMTGPEFVFNRFTRKRELYLARLRKVLSTLLVQDNFVLKGFASLLVPREFPHVLRVCVLDDPEARAKAAAEKLGCSLKQAASTVREEDLRAASWSEYLFGVSPWDRTLYDLKIPALSLGADKATALVLEAAEKLRGVSAPAVEEAVSDFQISSDAALCLADAGLYHRLTCAGGAVTVTINEYVAFFDRLEDEIRRVLQNLPNIRSIAVIAGPRFRPPTMFAENDFSLPKKVLLVDDEKDFVLTLSERLEMRDAAPSVAFNGEEALSMTAEEAPDVMILDLKMPGIDGMEVLRRVKVEHPEVAVIILTGHGTAADKEKCLALGAFDYLEKPVSIEVLSDAMRRAGQALEARRKTES